MFNIVYTESHLELTHLPTCGDEAVNCKRKLMKELNETTEPQPTLANTNKIV